MKRMSPVPRASVCCEGEVDRVQNERAPSVDLCVGLARAGCGSQPAVCSPGLRAHRGPATLRGAPGIRAVSFWAPVLRPPLPRRPHKGRTAFRSLSSSGGGGSPRVAIRRKVRPPPCRACPDHKPHPHHARPSGAPSSVFNFEEHTAVTVDTRVSKLREHPSLLVMRVSPWGHPGP